MPVSLPPNDMLTALLFVGHLYRETKKQRQRQKNMQIKCVCAQLHNIMSFKVHAKGELFMNQIL